MLEEIIKTRLMVKRSMKYYDKIAKSNYSDEKFKAIKRLNESLQKLLHARQLGLKLIANVTYGYTSANFSGRMPCIEVGKFINESKYLTCYRRRFNPNQYVYLIEK